MRSLSKIRATFVAVAMIFSLSAEAKKTIDFDLHAASSSVKEESQSWAIDGGRYALKTNALMFLGGVSNIGAEVALSKRLSIDLPLYYSPYAYSQNWSLKCLGTQPEFRFWLKKGAFKGHYIGAHAHVMIFNVAVNDGYRYESNDNEPSWGVGLSYGYAVNLHEHWGMEFSVGAGYTQLHYSRYFNADNGALITPNVKKNYYGVTKLGVVLTYQF